jgi:hypothetical protein
MNTKIVWLSVLLVAIIFASITFGTFESFVGSAPGVGQGIGIGSGKIAQQARANYQATGSINPTAGQQARANYNAGMSSSGTTENFWVGPRARNARQAYYN